ncbi:hypothetical protein KIN20_018449 [Parelaphostrongylus tenuis]|uniref:Uncharacterized protein n=1 Tax=Parelaphostrongylus tenuis TaxID=148309 RepID=A0AAD5QUC1_PARTN|nr:hypothetical protein KIN20_018449 [Parelaphostrongylus tenuis]
MPYVADLDVDKIRQECTIECNVNSFYRNIAAKGLDYRKQFQVIKSLRRNDSCTYAVLDFKKPYAVWTLMDAALHAVCPSVIYRRPDVYFVPIAIEEIYWNDKISPCSAQSIIVTTNKVAENEKFIRAHACIHVDGELLFYYKNKLSVVLKADCSVPSNVGAVRDVDSISLLGGDCHNEHASIEESANVSADEVEQEGQNVIKETEVYIISYDGTFLSDACDITELWQRIKTGALPNEYRFRDPPLKNNILMDTDITLWDPEFFGVSPNEARYIDVVQRLMMNSVLKCMERAAWTSMPRETGVFIGMSGSDFTNRVYSEIKDEVSGYFSTGTSGSCVAGRISHWLNLEGPAVVIDTACSSSFTALINALDAIIQGRCVHAIVGGVNVILHDTITQVLENAGMLSMTGKCQVFDADADGYVRSEAVACILLSKNRPGALFKISHWAISHNGRAASLNVPNGNAQERVIQLVNQKKVDHVECHGTGTSLGDPIEVRVVSKCYSSATISSAKALVGHSEAASGIVSLIHSLLQMKHNYRSNQVHFKSPNPKIDFSNLTLPIIGEERAVNCFVINNFGFSGTNCSIVVEKQSTKKKYKKYSNKYCLAPISSTSKHSLKAMIDQWKMFVSECDQAIVDICTKLQRVRSSYKYRHCILYNHKRQIVWESGKSVMDLEECIPIGEVDFMDFVYGNGFASYHSNGKGDLVDFCKLIIPNCEVNSIPTSMTPLRFHEFVAKEYVKGKSINWYEYNPITIPEQIVVPSYIFSNRRCWPFDEQFAYNFNSSKASKNTIHYERAFVMAPAAGRDSTLPVINVGKAVNLNGLFYRPILALQSSILEDKTRIILFHPYSSSIEDALSLISIWQLLEVRRNFVLIVACQNNGTSYTEWTALCRTLASECILHYKFVSYSTLQDLEAELSFNDVYECVFYKNSHRYVERLVVSAIKKTSVAAPKHLLITGGTGGIGKAIVKFLNPSKTTIITRSINDHSHETSEKFEELVEWDLHTLNLPEQHYDLVVHCAGAVDNALMASMDYYKFESVFKPKCCGLATIFEAVKERNPNKIVIASSVAAILGSVGQANYAFANGLMTSMAEKSPLSTQVIHWGPWKNVGMLQGTHFQKVHHQLKSSGWDTINMSEALMVLNSNATNLMVFKGDFKKITKYHVHLRKYLSEIVGIDTNVIHPGPQHERAVYRREVKHKTDVFSLESIISNVSGIDKLEDERNTPLMNLGIDSLMIEKIRTDINMEFGCNITSKDVYDNCTVNRLSTLIAIHTGAKIKPIVQTNNIKDLAVYHGDIAIIACSGAFSGCENISELWRNLLNGTECIVRKETQEDNFVDAAGIIEDIESFDYKFWKMTYDDASMLDPQLRVFLQNTYHALESQVMSEKDLT